VVLRSRCVMGYQLTHSAPAP